MRSKKAIYNIFTNLLLQLVVVIYGFIVPKIIIDKFGSSVNGLVNSITQFLAYITLLESGIGPVVKSALYKPIAKKDNNEISNILKASEHFFRNIAYIFLIYLVSLAIVYPIVVNREFDYFYTFSLVVIISISIFAEYYFGMTYKLFLQADQNNYVISAIQIISYIVSMIAIIIMVKIGISIHILKLISGLIFVGRPILQNLFVKKKYKINFNEYDKDYKLTRKWDGLSQHIASVIHHNTDITILTFFSSMVEVSVYSVYSLVINGINKLVISFSNGIDASFGDMLAKKEYDHLNKSFSAYEFIYYTIITIIFTCSLVLIIPFVKIYTKNVNDVNYIRENFAIILVYAEFFNMIRLPAISLTYSAGHFKETAVGAWIESISNIVISLIFFKIIGMDGLAIGTLIAMIIRTVEFIYYSSKNILKRNILKGFKKPIISIIESIMLLVILKNVTVFSEISYYGWIKYAVIVAIITTPIITIINSIIFYKDFINLKKKIFMLLKGGRKKIEEKN